jgi:adenylate cyclase
MKIYSKILLATLPLLLLAFVVAGGITFYLSRAALTDVAEQWLQTRGLEALRAAQTQVEFLEAYALNTVEASVIQAKNDAAEMMANIDIADKGYIFVVDASGRIAHGPDKSMPGRDVSDEPWFGEMVGASVGQITYRFQGQQYLASFHFFEPWQWYVIATDPEDEVYGAVNSLGSYVLFLGIAGTFLIALVLMLLTRRVTAPLADLVRGAERVGKGELTTTIPVRTQDEVGVLAHSFNEMTEQLRVLYDRLEERLTTVVSNAPIILFSLDHKGDLTLLEGKGLDTLGLDTNKAIGQPLSTVFGRSPEILAAADKALHGQTISSMASLDKLIFEIWCAPVVDSSSAISGAIGVATDVTDAQSAIHRAEEANKRVLEQNQMLESLSNKLSKYLSPQVYTSIFSGKQNVEISSKRKKLTVFFSDIVGFTETAEKLESEELTQLLNHYLTEMSQIALDHGATIDKYVGDAIVIFFGDPDTRGVKSDALACVKMAIRMRVRMRELEKVWRDSGIEKPLKCRIGINTGYCTVGNFGSEDRMDYTIIGGGVNLASRLETAADPGEILISYEAYAQVKDEVHCKEHGEVMVKGLAYPVTCYLVVNTHNNISAAHRSMREETANLKLDIDFDSMSMDQKKQATEILQRALDQLSS